MIEHEVMLNPRGRHRLPLCLAALVLVLGATAVAHSAYTARTDMAAIVRNNENLRSRQAVHRPSPSQQEVELQRHWKNLLQERSYPWAKVFRAVERATDPEIELLEFRPDRRQKTLVLKGEGRTAESVMRYLSHLQEDQTFSRVYLVHTAEIERGSLLTRSFEVRLNLSAHQLAEPGSQFRQKMAEG